MRFPIRGITLTAVAAVGMAAGAVPATASTVAHHPRARAKAASQAAPPAWKQVAIPDVPGNLQLSQVTAVSATDAWAVGSTILLPAGTVEPVVLQWNGTAWSQFAVAGIPDYVSLTSVAVANGHVWVSGNDNAAGGVVYRLSGTQWVSVAVPAGMNSVSLATSPNGQFWAYGGNEGYPYGGDDGPAADMTEIAGYTGTTPQAYPTGASTAAAGADLSFASSTDGYAVGTLNGGGPVVLHWNGTAWSTAPAPVPPKGTIGSLDSVLDTSSAGVWATGALESRSGAVSTWVVHWNGKSWTTVKVPSAFAPQSLFFDGNISAGESGGPQWISGNTGTGTTEYLFYAGGTFTAVKGTTGAPLQSGAVMDLAGVPGSDATWAISAQLDGTSSAGSAPRIEFAP